jgi:uncharacterized protein YjbJ (UPF0337 family)
MWALGPHHAKENHAGNRLGWPTFKQDYRTSDITQQENAMNWDRVEGNWKQFSGKVREKWGKLTDDDLAVVNGKQDQLIGRIQERYGIAKDEAQRQVKAWADDL